MSAPLPASGSSTIVSVKAYRCVAITGGIGEGKSTVLEHLASLGYRTASSDQIAREVLARESIQTELTEMLGRKEFSREQLREAIGTVPQLRRKLNRAMHGPILAELMRGNPQFVEIPLLIETCLHPLFQRVWVVTCGEKEQRKRLLERYGDAATVENLLGTQISTRIKIPFADHIVRTNEPRETVNAFVTQAAEREFARHVVSG